MYKFLLILPISLAHCSWNTRTYLDVFSIRMEAKNREAINPSIMEVKLGKVLSIVKQEKVTLNHTPSFQIFGSKIDIELLATRDVMNKRIIFFSRTHQCRRVSRRND